MKKKILNILALPLILIFISSCNDCPLQEQDPIYLCQTRIITMERFNPNFTVSVDPTSGAEIVTLDPDYNISMYEFPMNASSSGSFPNDNRFKGSMQIPVASLPFAVDNKIYYAAFVDTYPTNSDLAGDILVKDVDLSGASPVAFLRVKGSIAQIDQNYLNEDAQAFCDYVNSRTSLIQTSLQSYTAGNLYGANQPGATVNRYDSSPIVVTDQSGKMLGTVGEPNVPNPPQDVVNNLTSIARNKSSIDLRVVPGNVYTYIAKNGKRFVFFVSEIRQTNITPNRKRVSIMLFPLDK